MHQKYKKENMELGLEQGYTNTFDKKLCQKGTRLEMDGIDDFF